MNSKAISSIALTTLLVGCAHNIEKKPIDKSIPLDQNLTQFKELKREAKISQANILAPTEYNQGLNYLEETQSMINQQPPKYENLYEKMSYGMAYFEKADDISDERRQKYPDMLEVRDLALKAGVRNYDDLEERFTRIDDDLKRTMSDSYTVLGPNDASAFAGRYQELFKDVVKKNELGTVGALIEKLDDADFDNDAPKTYKALVKSYEETEKKIDQEPASYPFYRESLMETNKLALKSYRLMNIMRTTEGDTTEQAALVILKQDKKILALENQKDNLNWELAVALNYLRETGDTIVRQKAQVETLENKAALNLLAEKVKGQFPKDSVNVLIENNAVIVRMKEIPFKLNQTEVPKNSVKSIKKVGAVIKSSNPKKVVVMGHTDTTGDKKVNEKISEKRAVNVKKILAKEVPEDIITTKAASFERPLRANVDADKRAMNRRVDIVIVQ